MAHALPVVGSDAAPRSGWWTRLVHRTAAPRPDVPEPTAAPPEGPVAVEPAPAAPEVMRPRRTWASLLARCRAVTKADCVFAVEGEGLVVGRDGAYGRVEVDRIAAHLSRAFDTLSFLTEIGRDVESLCVQYDGGRWLTAIRIQPTASQTVTVGIVGPWTIVREDRQRLRDAFLKLFADGLPDAAEGAA
ncbi:MAG: hypothetical protein IT460_11010 [Planctomycetes bacterium]|nr:hypothetical protein [Planctomycetota bacterium]